MESSVAPEGDASGSPRPGRRQPSRAVFPEGDPLRPVYDDPRPLPEPV